MYKVKFQKTGDLIKNLSRKINIFGLLFGVVIFSIGAIALSNSNEDIVTLGGYPHAVAFCGEEGMGGSKEVITLDGGFFSGYKEEGIMYIREGNVFTVNVGHYNDEELDNLNSLAQINCNL